MTPERWRRVEALFEQALALPVSAREAFLASSAGDGDSEAEIAAEVREMLAADAEAGLLESQVRAAASDFARESMTQTSEPVSAAPSRTPRRAGPYRLTRELGRGGMGSVYLGERDDGEYEAQVAVKLIRAGLDTAFFLERFKRERQALARLEHPNIARIFDSGTTAEGLPYIVMELVRGEPITAYARRHQLGVGSIFTLYLEVCRAVSHAHRKFVVHRDLKPGNILVQEDGTPKLLDFGICKLLEDAPPGADTLTGLHLMTPEYASPEQILDRPITPASDVYSLAAVLFELLTGGPPHRIPSPNPSALIELARTPVPRPSTVAGSPERAAEMTGLLDRILTRALDKNPERRYQTVDDFAADLRRAANREHALAGGGAGSPEAASGRRQWPRRTWGAAVLGAAAVLGIGGGVSRWRGDSESSAPVNAQAMPLILEAHRIMKVRPPNETREGAHARARQAVQLFEQAAVRFPKSAQIQSGLAEAYLGLADYDQSTFYDSMKLAREAAERGLALDSRLEELHQSLGEALLFGFWKPQEALESFHRAVRLNAKLGHAQRLRADILGMFGRFEEAMSALDAVQAVSPLDTEVGAERASLFFRWRRYAQAEQAARETLAVDPAHEFARFVLGLALQHSGRPEEAAALYRALPPRPVRYPLALAHLLLTTGRAAEAAPMAAEIRRRNVSPSATALLPAGEGRRDEALALIEEAAASRDINLLYVPMDPRYDSLREEPRFIAVFRSLGLPHAPHSRK